MGDFVLLIRACGDLDGGNELKEGTEVGRACSDALLDEATVCDMVGSSVCVSVNTSEFCNMVGSSVGVCVSEITVFCN